MAEAGVTTLRVPFYWNALQPYRSEKDVPAGAARPLQLGWRPPDRLQLHRRGGGGGLAGEHRPPPDRVRHPRWAARNPDAGRIGAGGHRGLRRVHEGAHRPLRPGRLVLVRERGRAQAPACATGSSGTSPIGPSTGPSSPTRATTFAWRARLAARSRRPTPARAWSWPASPSARGSSSTRSTAPVRRASSTSRRSTPTPTRSRTWCASSGTAAASCARPATATGRCGSPRSPGRRGARRERAGIPFETTRRRPGRPPLTCAAPAGAPARGARRRPDLLGELDLDRPRPLEPVQLLWAARAQPRRQRGGQAGA